MWKLLADILEYHRSLIADTARCDAFHRAIHQVVKPGDVVVDIGTGSGLLAMFAVQAGASHVYALEEGMVADLAETLFRANGVQDRISLYRGRSWEARLPEQADVVISETLWNFGVGEGILKTLSDAKRRFLKPEGRLIPASMSLQVAPIEAPARHQELARWNEKVFGVDVSAAYPMAKSNLYRMVLEADMLLAEGQSLGRLTLGEDSDWVRGQVEMSITRAGTVHGLGGWFDAELAEGVRLHNRPPSPAPNWKQAYMPLPEPIVVKPGDRLWADVQCVGDESAFRWAVKHFQREEQSPSVRTWTHSTLGGFPTALERLAAP